jgi:hypothetical protein
MRQRSLKVKNSDIRTGDIIDLTGDIIDLTGDIIDFSQRNNLTVRSLEEVRNRSSQGLTEQRYRILVDTCLDLHEKQKKVNKWEQKSESMAQFLQRAKKVVKK